MSIGRAVLDHAASQSNLLAILTAEGGTSYGQLGGLAEDARRRLATLPKGRIAIVMRNDAASAAHLIAADLAGRTAVLLPPALPQSEKMNLAMIGRAVAILEGSRIAHSLGGDAHKPEPEEDPLICQLTSGSTGPPRLAARSGEGVWDEIEAVRRRLSFKLEDRVLCASSIAHSYALVGGLLSSLASGAGVILANAGNSLPLLRCRPTILFGLPSTYANLLPSAIPDDLDDLRLAFSAGAPLPAPTFHGWQSRFGMPIRQDYGTTETGTISLDSGSDVEPGSVGLPMDHLDVRIEAGEGARAEIQVRGEAVSKVFLTVEGPVPAIDGDGWYKTGDSGKLSAGRLYVGARIREPLRGAAGPFPPELVEAIISRMPGVVEVVAVNTRMGFKAVVAAPSLSARDILGWCHEHLPAEQLPASIDVRDALPRSPAGKVLHKDLAG